MTIPYMNAKLVLLRPTKTLAMQKKREKLLMTASKLLMVEMDRQVEGCH